MHKMKDNYSFITVYALEVCIYLKIIRTNFLKRPVKICRKYSIFLCSQEKESERQLSVKSESRSFSLYLFIYISLCLLFWDAQLFLHLCWNLWKHVEQSGLQQATRKISSAPKNDWSFRLSQIMSETLVISCLHSFEIKMVLFQIGCWIILNIVMFEGSM